MSIIITLSHDKETIETLRDEWIDLQNRSSASGMALTWHWIYLWYKHVKYYGELWLMTAREGNRLIGIAPLMKVKEQPDRGFAWQQIQFIGVIHESEHLDFLIESGYEEEVIPMFIDKLLEHKSQWDVISLINMSDTKTIDILQKSDRNWVENPKKSMLSLYVTLPDTMDEWMSSIISRKHRKNLRRYLNLLDKQFPDRWSITQITQPDDLNYTYEHLVSLHETYWRAKDEPGSFYDGELVDYYRELAHCMLENGWLRLYRLDIDNKPCAIDFCYHYRGRLYGQVTGVNREVTNIPLGMVVKYYCIEQAISDGLCEFSFMQGAKPWKYSFGGVDRTHRAFELVSSPRIQLQIQIVNLLRKVKAHFRKIKSHTDEIVPDVSMDEVDEE